MVDSYSYIIPLEHLGVVAIRGTKAMDFLQGQLTCDMREVTLVQTRLAAHCNVKGRVLSSFRVIQYDGQLYLITPKTMQAAVIQQLTKPAQLSRVTLEIEDKLQLLGCVGDSLSQKLTTYFPSLPAATDSAQPGNNALAIRIRNDQTRFLIVHDSTLPLASLDYPRHDDNYWQLLEIQSGIASIQPGSSGLFTPHMLNYPALNAVSFKKGCYIGQEVVARTEYLGKSKRGLWLASMTQDTLPSPGDPLYGEEETPIGTVVEAAFDEVGKCQLLAVVNTAEIE